MAYKRIAKSGLLPIKFDAPGHRTLLFHPGKNLLYVDSPFADKSSLSRLGGTWVRSDPKGWTWYFTLPNLEMLLDIIPFDTVDEALEGEVIKEQKRIANLTRIRKAALENKEVFLRVPGLKISEEMTLRNYQKLGIEFATLVNHGFLLGDEMGLGKCATGCSKVYIKNKGSISLESVWKTYSDSETTIREESGEWRNLNCIDVLGFVNSFSKYQKAIRIYREKVKNVASIQLQDGSLLSVGFRHQFLSVGFKGMDWVPASQLKEGDWIMVSRKIKECSNELNDISKEEAELLAWQISEGHEAEGKRNIFSIYQDKTKTLQKLEKIFDQFGFDKSDKSGIVKNKGRDSPYLRIASRQYKGYITEKYSDYGWGALSGDKIIPEKIENSNIEIARIFLKSYFDAEGCCNKDNLEISSKSEKIIRSLHYMLRRFGVLGIISNKVINTPKWGDCVYWRITIGGIYAKVFQKEIGFGYQYKKEKLEILCEKSENTNVGNSIPCKPYLQMLMSLSQCSNRMAGMESSVYISDKNHQNLSSKSAQMVVDSFQSMLDSGVSETTGRWENRYDQIQKNIDNFHADIQNWTSLIQDMISDDFMWLQVKKIENKEYNDYVYDLEIEGEHNYIVDMAIGHNSVQAIGIAVWRKKFNGAKRCLIVSPASVKYNWLEELELWTDEKFTIIDGPPNKREEQWSRNTYFTVVNPELIVRDYDDIMEIQTCFDIIIIDEIHMLKSWKSKRSKFMKKLKLSENGLRIGLSGTPIDGKLEDLHSIFEFLVPSLFTTRGKFLDRYAIRDEYNAVTGYINVDEVRSTIEPYFLRRLKEEVAKELPEKIFKNVYVELSTEERKIYNAIRNHTHEITQEAEAITAILRARQFCDAPVLVDEYPEFGAKYEVCMELLEEVIGNGHKVLVFSMFEQMVDRLYVQFEKRGWKSSKITGRVKQKDRPTIAREFNEDPTIDICVMDEAGATGLNFQGASYVLHYDDNWSPAIMKQRTDRAHRLTTKHTVTVINFICKDTIEDRVRNVLTNKDELSASAIGDDMESVCAIKTLGVKDALKLL